MLVVDATVALASAGTDNGLDYFEDDLVAPPLMWSESRSVLHEMAWRGEIDLEDAMATRLRLERSRIRQRNPAKLGAEALPFPKRSTISSVTPVASHCAVSGASTLTPSSRRRCARWSAQRAESA